MIIKPHKIEVTATLELTGRELELLHHIMSYDNKKWFAASVRSSTYAGVVTEDEVIKFMENLRATSCDAINHINAGKDLLRK